MSRSFLYCHKIAFSWCCFSFPSVLNLKLPTEKGGWCMFLFQTICLWWMSKVPALSALIFNVWLSFVVLVRSVYLLSNLVSQPEGCHGSIKCHHLSPRQVFPSAMVWLLTRFWHAVSLQVLRCLLQSAHIYIMDTSKSGQVNSQGSIGLTERNALTFWLTVLSQSQIKSNHSTLYNTFHNYTKYTIIHSY